MSQTHGFQHDNLKYMTANRPWPLDLLRKVNVFRWRSNTELLRLTSRLNDWNTERISRKSAAGQSHDLSIEDVNLLKEMVYSAIHATSLKDTKVFSDQVFFLVIGAIQIQSQTGSDKTWKLVNQSIQSFLNSQKEKQVFLFGLMTLSVAICMTAMTINNTRLHSSHSSVENDLQDSPMQLITGNTADPVTISTIQLAYKKMKSGICQLPQAAMLPPEQRQAYLLFVNEGIIEVEHVENLRLALGYVNCLYPQELMHPPPPL